ncbi:chromosome segregation protein SMC [Legionella norrlandica]|uniref:Chromosome partition protein Smc n=1 Tax=Legionella norrlandica TaxID=1498499 RepID=A0A0A2SXM6_9GAMM|nr:chromosome segregation protein SMC [Legionella norrlandica]KGP64209.1 chromosome segregation protein SMC [Legionella norrlandica]
MHLKQLKLSGFKSFVDPSVVHFPSQLVAVVGPNGCGKSNIIDAVRWVMGESSAKNLRGESMTDVIFNGSANRKPVGQASVELIFDNSLGRLSGPFTSYHEISVKRVVTRDGESLYYLNGSRCRRKDITDIFLGTGAGARSYSIIGQGTISQIIEAKPEDLRAYLEEAAGVSKYKERRRETLQRIEHTRDNLTRVADIREELNKHLQRLERQAKSAERYILLKEEEKGCRAEIQALKWQEYSEKQIMKQRELQEHTIHYEQQQGLLTNASKERIILNEQLQEAIDKSQIIQDSLYHSGTEIARLEETIQQQEKEKKRLEIDKQRMRADSLLIEEQLKLDNEELLNSKLKAEQLEERLHHLNVEFKEKESQWHDKQNEQVQWERIWQEVQIHSNTIKNEYQLTQAKLQHLEQKRQQAILRLEKLSLDQSSISLAEMQKSIIELQEKQIKLKETQRFDEGQFEEVNETQSVLRNQLQDTEQQLHSLQDEFHRLNSELSALKAAQKAIKQRSQLNQEGIMEWSDKPRLMDILQVEPKWQAACEMVLGDDLCAYVLEDFSELWSQWLLYENQRESAVTMRTLDGNQRERPCLADKIQGLIPATENYLESIYAAEHLDEAMSWLPTLLAHESIITVNGIWLGNGWIKLSHPAEYDETGILARQKKIVELNSSVQDLQNKIDAIRLLRDGYQAQIKENLDFIKRHQLNLNSSNEALKNNTIAINSKEQAVFHAEKQLEIISNEKAEAELLLEELNAELLECSEKLNELKNQYESSELRYQQFMDEKSVWNNAQLEQNKQLESTRALLHHVELEHDREVSKIQQITDRIGREKERLQRVQTHLEELIQLYLQSVTPETELKNQLETLLMKHREIELELTLSREKVSQIKLQLEEQEKLILNYDQELKRIQEVISQTRMEEQALSVRAGSVQESLDEMNLQARVLLGRIPTGVTQGMKEDELIAISEKIKRLGAINLAAIEEFAAEQQRKVYLDEQYNDLSQALSTLETAIEKMDNETRVRLENTFEEVNTSFKALFPRLFGGGRAQLELTCDNLLEAGIVVMAQPPGKRNSSIHLLSGGEKAMTAVALVFAIFQLNPSPFCMLDEVDAPLDDLNVSRFCDLVKEMSQFVQFLFITHNKVTMELADHLIGVTMREPGVSRLVAVDVKQALTME